MESSSNSHDSSADSNSSNDSEIVSINSSNESNEITCLGCRDGILNQLGHIDKEGGCLYEEYTYINESS